jgi:hypothetical protein
VAVIQQRVSDLSGRILDDETTVKIRVEYPHLPDKVQVIEAGRDEIPGFEDKGVWVAKRGRKTKAPAAS